MQHLYEGKAEQDRKPREFDAAKIDRAPAAADFRCDRSEIAQKGCEELAGEGFANRTRGLACLLIRIAQDRQEIELAATKRQTVQRAKRKIADRVDADEKDIRIRRMEGNEIADIGFQPAHFLSARVERVNETYLVAP
ncbi:hypothetical protein [Afipia sp. P52-10]|uniref:hypothetical protein n=1 Tax=Afipia sp. P52-10 TaxID=1429916 RepID=UPI001FCC11B8|nr:hypothetical protein [Afipia sp. P52-10]